MLGLNECVRIRTGEKGQMAIGKKKLAIQRLDYIILVWLKCESCSIRKTLADAIEQISTRKVKLFFGFIRNKNEKLD